MIRLFKSVHPSALFMIPVITLLLWIPGLLKESFTLTEYHGIFSSNLIGFIGAFPRLIQVLLAILLVSFEGIYLNLIVNKHEVLNKNTYLPALLYVILMSCGKEMISFNEILIVNLLLILTCDKIFSLFKNENPVSLIFDCGLLLSLCSFIYFPCIVFLLFFLIVLLIQRPFSFREWSIALIAFSLPYFFALVYFFLTDSLSSITEKFNPDHSLDSLSEFHLPTVSIQQSTSILLFVFFLFIMLALSLMRLRKNYYKNTIKTRSAQQVLIALALFIIAELLLFQKVTFINLSMLAIPFSIFLAYYYSTVQKRLWLLETSFWVFIVLIMQRYFLGS